MDTLLKQGSKLTFDGTEYTMRRLGIRDVFKVAKIFAKMGSSVIGDLANANGDADTMGFIILTAIPESEDLVIELLASLLDIGVTDFDKLPLEALPQMITELVESEDLKSFLAQVAKLVDTFKTKDAATSKS